MQGAGIENIQQIWKESHIALQSIVTAEPPEAGYPVSVPIIASVLLLALLYGFPILTSGFISAAEALFRRKKLSLIEHSSGQKTNREITLLFIIVLFSFISSNGQTLPFFYFFLGILLFLFIRLCIFLLLDWIGKSQTFKELNGYFHNYFIILCTVSLIGSLLCLLFPGLNVRWVTYTVEALSAAILTGFFISGYQLIISNGFSHSFWILYLCTLEILPLIVFMHICLVR